MYDIRYNTVEVIQRVVQPCAKSGNFRVSWKDSNRVGADPVLFSCSQAAAVAARILFYPSYGYLLACLQPHNIYSTTVTNCAGSFFSYIGYKIDKASSVLLPTLERAFVILACWHFVPSLSPKPSICFALSFSADWQAGKTKISLAFMITNCCHSFTRASRLCNVTLCTPLFKRMILSAQIPFTFHKKKTTFQIGHTSRLFSLKTLLVGQYY